MNTLSNVHTRRGGTEPPHIGFASDVSPKCENTQIGVSVEYAPDPNKHWYVLRATYGREQKAYDFMKNDRTEAYLPLHYVLKETDGRKKRVLEPLIPNILFVYATPETVELYVKRTAQLSYVNYYYNHFSTGINGKNLPLTVQYEDMMNFIVATRVRNDHILVVNETQCHYKRDDIVLITQGEFAGVRGRVARVSGQQRVVISLEGVCSIATAYIPSAFIEKID